MSCRLFEELTMGMTVSKIKRPRHVIRRDFASFLYMPIDSDVEAATIRCDDYFDGDVPLMGIADWQ